MGFRFSMVLTSRVEVAVRPHLRPPVSFPDPAELEDPLEVLLNRAFLLDLDLLFNKGGLTILSSFDAFCCCCSVSDPPDPPDPFLLGSAEGSALILGGFSTLSDDLGGSIDLLLGP